MALSNYTKIGEKAPQSTTRGKNANLIFTFGIDIPKLKLTKLGTGL